MDKNLHQPKNMKRAWTQISMKNTGYDKLITGIIQDRNVNIA